MGKNYRFEGFPDDDIIKSDKLYFEYDNEDYEKMEDIDFAFSRQDEEENKQLLDYLLNQSDPKNTQQPKLNNIRKTKTINR